MWPSNQRTSDKKCATHPHILTLCMAGTPKGVLLLLLLLGPRTITPLSAHRECSLATRHTLVTDIIKIYALTRKQVKWTSD